MPLFLEVGPTGYFSGPISSWSLYDKGFPLFTKSDLVKRGITSVPFILYGTGDNADKLNARALSHTSFTVSSDASDSMQVDIAVPEITPSVSSKTLYFAQSEAITKKYSSIDDDTFASVTNSDPSIVKAVISDGKLLVKGKRKEGTAILTILSENGLTATVTVTVKKGTVAKLKKTKGSVRLKKTLKIALKKGSYSGDKIYRCKSSNKKIAKVTNTGKITGKKKGKATITVTLLSGATKKFKVTVS